MTDPTRLLFALVFEVAITVGILLAATLLIVVGPAQLRTRIGGVRARVSESLGVIALLFGVMLFNRYARPVVPELSWAIGLPVTDAIYRIEGSFVVSVQRLARPWLTAYLAFAYVHLYVFLLAVPFVVYAFADDSRPLRVAGIAYAVNYAVGIVCYVLFIAYGPRNFLVGEVDSLLYTTYPSLRLLTAEINVNTNAFPSLHTSMAMTVALLSVWTRGTFARLPYLVVPCTLSIVVATIYLGLHWLIDVLAGIALAVIAFGTAVRVIETPGKSREWFRKAGELIRQ